MIVLYIIGGYCLACYIGAGIFCLACGLFSGRPGNSGDLGLIVLLLFAPIAIPWFLFDALKRWLSR